MIVDKGFVAPPKSSAVKEKVKRVIQVVRTARRLPTPPVVISRLTELLADPNYRTADLVRLVEMDAGLATDTLSLANSAMFRRGDQEIESIQRAVETLGERRLTQLLVARAGASMQTTPLLGYDVGKGRGLWIGSLHRAIAAETVARRSQAVPWSRAYTVGLLMDIGKLALGGFLRVRRQDADWLTAEHARQDLSVAEDRLLGIDHAELGARLAWRWELPEHFQQAIRFHHRPADAPEDHQALAYTAHLADIVASSLGLGGGAGELDYREDPGWSKALGIPRSQLQLIAEEVDIAAREAVSMLS